jgi:hypothetical protein
VDELRKVLDKQTRELTALQNQLRTAVLYFGAVNAACERVTMLKAWAPMTWLLEHSESSTGPLVVLTKMFR